MFQRKVNPRIIARGTDLGDGYCLVRHDWLPEKTFKVAAKNGLVLEGMFCIVSNEFIDCPWNATAVYSSERVEYTEADL